MKSGGALPMVHLREGTFFARSPALHDGARRSADGNGAAPSLSLVVRHGVATRFPRVTSSVRVEQIADCPYSVAQSYAEDYLAAAQRGGEPETVVRAGPVHVPVRFGFEIRNDDRDPGRQHEEIVLRWTAQSALLPNFAGTLRFRIHGAHTRFILEGTYTPPGGMFGVLFDRIAGRFIARATAADLVTHVVLRAQAREAAWRAGILRPSARP